MDQHTLKTYKQARIAKDKNFDGLFYFSVKTTGVFCRPSCPAPIAKEENVTYYNSIFGALNDGFRPCHRCRPDLNCDYSRHYIPGSEIVSKALNLIYTGFLSYHSIEDMAAAVCISPRQLRKLFTDCIGISPVTAARYHKALFAKKMLLSSKLPITGIAYASGFTSIRQFNATFKEIFNESPSSLRKRSPHWKNQQGAEMTIQLKYDKPFDYNQMLAFMQPRLIDGVEKIENAVYFRSFRTETASGWFSVRDNKEDSALELVIDCEDIRCSMELYDRVRAMFDLDTDFSRINSLLGSDRLLQKGMIGESVPGLPTAFSPYEFAIRAILGQQISVKAATTLAGRIAVAAGKQLPANSSGIQYFFPTPEELSETDISNLGITKTRQSTIRTVTEAVLDGRLKLSTAQTFEDFAKSFGSLKGIGDWTVNYTAMRGLGMKNAFPASDLGIIKAMSHDGIKPTVKQITAAAEKWQPYRSYAALCLWNIQGRSQDTEQKE